MLKLAVDIGGTYIRMALSEDGQTFLSDPQKIKRNKKLQLIVICVCLFDVDLDPFPLRGEHIEKNRVGLNVQHRKRANFHHVKIE